MGARRSVATSPRPKPSPTSTLIRHEGTILDDPAPSARPLSADPDDEYLVDLARAAPADVLVSGDAHLLDLRDRLPVMTPAEFLATLGG